MIRSTRTVADVALVPEGDVFQGGDGVAAQHARQAGQAFPGDGIALVRHGAGTFLAFRERFLGFEHFGALQMAEFHRPAFDARADQGERGHEFGVDVALDHLRGDGRGRKPEFFADKFFHARRQDARWCRRRRKVCRRRRRSRARSSRSQRAAKFIVHQRQFQAERRRLGVDAVAAPDQGVNWYSFARAGDDWQQLLCVGDENVRACVICTANAVSHDIAAGQAEMQPAAGGVVDFFGDGGGEADDVVVERFFQFLLRVRPRLCMSARPFLRAGFILAKSALGTMPSSTSASLASSSICSQILSLFSSVQMARISGRE